MNFFHHFLTFIKEKSTFLRILTTTKWWSFDHHFPPSLLISYLKTMHTSLTAQWKSRCIQDHMLPVFELANSHLQCAFLESMISLEHLKIRHAYIWLINRLISQIYSYLILFVENRQQFLFAQELLQNFYLICSSFWNSSNFRKFAQFLRALELS